MLNVAVTPGGPPRPARCVSHDRPWWSWGEAAGGRRQVLAGARGRPRHHTDFTPASGDSREVGVASLSQMRDTAHRPGHRMERAPGRKQRGRVSA